MLPPPTLRESIEQAFTVSRMTSDAAQRASLLRMVTEALAEPARAGGWAAALHARATADLTNAARTDQAYADHASKTLRRADDRLDKADVKGLESIIRDVLKQDDRLGRQRPQDVAALLATLDTRLDSARRLRLARDRWTLRLAAVRAYQRRARRAMDLLGRIEPSLELIRQLAGPGPKTLQQLQKNTASASREFDLIKPAPDVEAVHGLLTSAFQMAVRAAETRTRAIASNDMNLAWQASSAAAGALLLVERAREELKRLASPPVL
jgi:hypothetical protein